MQRRVQAIVAVCCVLCLFSAVSFSQDQPAGTRKVVNKISPTYPSLARTMNISGMVKLEVTVAPNGTVKNVEVRGGHPVLSDAAIGAVYKWRWEAAPHETQESVEVKFGPQ